MKSKTRKGKGSLLVNGISDEVQQTKRHMQQEMLDKKTFKALQKSEKRSKKQKPSSSRNVFVVEFDGDIQASATDSLREEISAILAVASTADEVVVKLDSGGGVVHGYGLAASQLQRIKDKGVGLTVCVDKVAASGGYMMACVADKVVAAPFAIVGSIGVVAQIPNIHRLLDKNDIDVELHTAGQFKRTLTVLGENTDEGREKFKQDLERTHELFKRHVALHRPALDIDKIATGEIWYGSEAKELGLVDVIQTSDDYVLDRCMDANVLKVSYRKARPMSERLGLSAMAVVEDRARYWAGKIMQHRGF
jgi:serine protease SohB